jgi:sugar lactone lactonase YvrE
MRKMNVSFLPTITLMAIVTVPALAVPMQTQRTIQLPPQFQYPNGITHASDGTLYVGSVTSGQILRITPDGKITPFFAGTDDIFAATSLRLDEQRGILWGASPDFLGVRNADGQVTRRSHRIFAIDVRTSQVLRVIPLPDRGFGNDITVDKDGGIYLTDSSQPRIYYLAPGTDQLQVWAENEQFRAQQIGLSGIARAANGTLIVGLFSDGKLLKVTPQTQGTPKVEAVPLPRLLENPDGIQFAPDGSLLVTEGAIASGEGRLLRIKNVLSPGTTPKAIETLATGLESPLNLTVAGQTVYVTEARIRHRLLPGRENQVPDRFFVHQFQLSR